MKWLVLHAFLRTWWHHTTPRHSHESDYMGLRAKKLPVGPMRHYVKQTLFWHVKKHFLFQLTHFSYFNNLDYLSVFYKRFIFKTLFCFSIRDPVRDPIRSGPIRSGPIRSDPGFVDAVRENPLVLNIMLKGEIFMNDEGIYVWVIEYTPSP